MSGTALPPLVGSEADELIGKTKRVDAGGTGLTPSAILRLGSSQHASPAFRSCSTSLARRESDLSNAAKQENEATAHLFMRPRRRTGAPPAPLDIIAAHAHAHASAAGSPAMHRSPLSSPEADSLPSTEHTTRRISRYSREGVRPPRVHPDMAAAYTFISVLGAGSFGTVWAARQKETGTLAAIKIVDRTSHSDGEFRLEPAEAEILKRCSHHENIVKLLDYYASDTSVYLAMELVDGGNVQERLDENGPYGEADGARIFGQIVSAVHHLHEQSITHRDIKPENILFTHRGADAAVKLTDFGLSTMKTGRLTAKCGTPSYCAPELLSGIGYGREVDLWALGVVAYVLMVGDLPFTGHDRNALFKSIQIGHYSYPEGCEVSSLARDIISRLLRLSPIDRYSTHETLQHPWLNGGGVNVTDGREEATLAGGVAGVVEAPLDTVIEMMRRFNAQERWRRAALAVLAVVRLRRHGAAVARARQPDLGETSTSSVETWAEWHWQENSKGYDSLSECSSGASTSPHRASFRRMPSQAESSRCSQSSLLARDSSHSSSRSATPVESSGRIAAGRRRHSEGALPSPWPGASAKPPPARRPSIVARLSTGHTNAGQVHEDITGELRSRVFDARLLGGGSPLTTSPDRQHVRSLDCRRKAISAEGQLTGGLEDGVGGSMASDESSPYLVRNSTQSKSGKRLSFSNAITTSVRPVRNPSSGSRKSLMPRPSPVNSRTPSAGSYRTTSRDSTPASVSGDSIHVVEDTAHGEDTGLWSPVEGGCLSRNATSPALGRLSRTSCGTQCSTESTPGRSGRSSPKWCSESRAISQPGSDHPVNAHAHMDLSGTTAERPPRLSRATTGRSGNGLLGPGSAALMRAESSVSAATRAMGSAETSSSTSHSHATGPRGSHYQC